MSDERVSDDGLQEVIDDPVKCLLGEIAAMIRELQQSRKRIDELEKLVPYVRHARDCDRVLHGYEKCTCGLSALIGGE